MAGRNQYAYTTLTYSGSPWWGEIKSGFTTLAFLVSPSYRDINMGASPFPSPVLVMGRNQPRKA